MKSLIAIIVLSFVSLSFVVAQHTDSVSNSRSQSHESKTPDSATTDAYDGTDDFSTGMAFIVLIAVGFILVCVGAGIALAVAGLLMIFALISFGVISASVLVGINKKSFALGFKTFLVSSSTIGAFIIFTLAFWGLNKVIHWWTTQAALAIGATFGLIIGLSFGFIAFYVLRLLTTFLSRQLKLNR